MHKSISLGQTPFSRATTTQFKYQMINCKRGIIKRIADIINPYSWITATRNRLFDAGLLTAYIPTIPTICIGNISVGGTGKTPHTEYLIRLLKEKWNIAVLSRGYGRKSKGYILADTDTAMPIIGDEPFQIKSKFNDIKVAVCEKRAIGIEHIKTDKKDCNVILLDDSFQHRHVKAGLNILLIDSSRPIWQDCILPFGRMRESENGIKRADIAVITKCNGLSNEQKAWCKNYIKGHKDIPVFFSSMRYGNCYPLFHQEQKEIVAEMNVLLVTGIARPEPLKKEIERRGAIVKLMRYADHHNFTANDLADIELQYKSIDSCNKIIVTTEKDATRLLHHPDTPQTVKENIHVLPIEVEILDNETNVFNKMIQDYVTENSRNS